MIWKWNNIRHSTFRAHWRVIYKELNPFDNAAQEQMAYRLRRAFVGSQSLDVVNSLVLRTGNLQVQMQQLVLHPFGLILIDNLSLPGSISVDDDWKWTHSNEGESAPILSPVTAVKVQALALDAFLKKKVKQKSFFNTLEIDVLVAVPDVRAIHWPASGVFPEVCNADEVPERVSACVAQYRHDAKTPPKLVAEHRQRLAEFLRASHKGKALAGDFAKHAANTANTANSAKAARQQAGQEEDSMPPPDSELDSVTGPDWLPSSRMVDLD
jgi:Nuclease-related domain